MGELSCEAAASCCWVRYQAPPRTPCFAAACLAAPAPPPICCSEPLPAAWAPALQQLQLLPARGRCHPPGDPRVCWAALCLRLPLSRVLACHRCWPCRLPPWTPAQGRGVMRGPRRHRRQRRLRGRGGSLRVGGRPAPRPGSCCAAQQPGTTSASVAGPRLTTLCATNGVAVTAVAYADGRVGCWALHAHHGGGGIVEVLDDPPRRRGRQGRAAHTWDQLRPRDRPP